MYMHLILAITFRFNHKRVKVNSIEKEISAISFHVHLIKRLFPFHALKCLLLLIVDIF